METDKQDLSPKQKELVAVGASVGAGCHPCVSHHLKAGTQAGLDDGKLLAAVTSAERVASEASVLVADHARGQLAPAVTAPATLTSLEDALAALGAALGANDAAAIDLQLRSALDAGAARSQLEQAIETAKSVQETAGRIHVRKAEQLLDELAPVSAVDETDGKARGDCGCGSDGETEPRESADEAGDVEDDTRPGFGFEAPMAELFGSAGDGESFGRAAMMALCRQMFGRAFGSSETPAEKKATPTTAAEPRGCSDRKEV